MKNEEKHLIDCGIPAELARKIDRTNRHEHGLSVLGILPNQLRTILRDSTESRTDAEKAWIDISKTLFWQGYAIWSMRKKLNKVFWKDIAPSEWNKYNINSSIHRKAKQKAYLSRRKRKHHSTPSSCSNPFHFLHKCGDYSKEKPTNCPCSQSHRPMKRSVIHDIRSLISSFPKLLPISIGDIERTVYIKERIDTEKESRSILFTTHDDLVRDEHDRGKKRKQASITMFLQPNKTCNNKQTNKNKEKTNKQITNNKQTQ
jgi:hypothetical protein